MASSPTWLVLRLLALGIPLTFALAIPLVSRGAPFRRANQAAFVTLGLAAIVAVLGPVIADARTEEPASLLWTVANGIRLDVVTSIMLALVCSIALVIVRYSQTYLAGDSGQQRYVRSLLATLATVTTLVVANNLLVIALAWMGTSLALHQLLTFYRERPQALIAAHKKFLLSRLADACLLCALVLVRSTVGSLDLDDLHAWARAEPNLPPALQVAGMLLAIGASLKSAQLPFHGWLTQVMEAPTPVSALLHAGVVNIGGFVMIRLAPFMAHAAPAQMFLVIIGTTTAVVAALVMTTRVSVKVALAWSTCAQMGFMLVQCGLGAWHLALLHLVAHSLYKAHAFLSSGGAVDDWRVQSLSPRQAPVTIVQLLVASPLVLVVAATPYTLTQVFGARLDPTLVPLSVLVSLSLLPLVARGVASNGRRALPGVALRTVGVTALYFGWHAASERLGLPRGHETLNAGWFVVLGGFSLLFGAQLILQTRPRGRLARWLQPRLFAGLYLDELFTRMTFRLWPPRLLHRNRERASLRVPSIAEARS